jgi:hypothetical protein
MRGLPCGSSRQAMQESLVEELLLALNSPDELKGDGLEELRGRSGDEHAARRAEYIRSFRQHERVKTLQLAASLASRRSIPSRSDTTCSHGR